MIDFTIFYKTSLSTTLGWKPQDRWDLLISAFNSSERVRKVFSKVTATEKYWLVCPEYKYQTNEHPTGLVYKGVESNEADFIKNYFDSMNVDLSGKSVCVDTTGFIRPYLLFLIQWFLERGVKRFDAIYSEPTHYRQKESTQFSKGGIRDVRQVAKYEGNHNPDTSNDVLIIGSGYDTSLISGVAEAKNKARKIQLLGFPSLRADMFQENLLRVQLAEDALGTFEKHFAPAHDPFVTADALKMIINELNQRQKITNLYLCPLATKAQVLGFAIYYIAYCRGQAASIIYPISESYERETATGIARIWKYTVELSALIS